MPDTEPPPIPKRAIPRQATSAVAFEGSTPAPDDPLLSFTPVPHKRPRRNSITPALQRKFIAHLAATGIVTAAARHIGKSMEAIYKLRQRPGAASFNAAWDAAIDRGVTRLEATALTRAMAGEERMVVSSGKILGTEIRHNEALVMFFLRNRLPHRYGTSPLKPGHPDYDKMRADMHAELRAAEKEAARSPERMQEIADWLLEFKQRWRREWESEAKTT
ncbi:MAG: hypothetical protein ABJ239_09990 [Erythrobacter sp.]